MKLTNEEAIAKLREATGVEYSDEQLEILNAKDGMCILSGAGSGKTTVLTHLIAKRTMTGEIKNPKKVLVCTYSRAGQEELEARLNKLLDKVGCDATYEVKTLHASYLNMLSNVASKVKVCTAGERTQAIIEACRASDITLGDDEKLQKVDSILSYQINNMLTDKALEKEYIFDLDEGIDKYAIMRNKFNEIKRSKGFIDFDDMQSMVYYYMCNKPQVRELFRSYYDDFYIDEFQDTSKIQFEILKMLLKDENKLVVIGDDDQCIVEGTMVRTPDGEKTIEKVAVGDKLIAACGHGATKTFTVDNVSKKKVHAKVVKITTEKGHVIEGTEDHVGFARYADGTDFEEGGKKGFMELDFELFGSLNKQNGVNKSNVVIDLDKNKYGEIMSERLMSPGNQNVKKVGNKIYMEATDDQAEEIQTKMTKKIVNVTTYNKYAYITNTKYQFMKFGNMQVGMMIPVYNKQNGRAVDDKIVSIEVSKYHGNVYDISVPEARNFIAGDVVVHNCIYQWRGADPSIILNIAGYYDIGLYKLSTNYRCKSEIVDRAANSIKHNEKRLDKELKAFNKGGEIEVYGVDSGDIYAESRIILDEIKKLIEAGVEENEIAVLMRNNAYGCILYDMLLNEKIVPRATEDIKFGKSKLVYELMSTVSFMADKLNSNVVGANLWKYVKYMSAMASKKFGEVMNNNGCTIEQVLKAFLTQVGGEPISDDTKIIDIRPSEFRMNLRYDSIVDMKNIYDVLVDNEISDSQKVMTLMYKLYKNSQYRIKSGDTDRQYQSIIKYIADRVDQVGIAEYTEEVERHKAMSNIQITSGQDRLTLSTMHGAKGKEWKYVFIMCDDNMCLPSAYEVDKMIDSGIDMEEIYSYIEQERRLHYVAMTRAKEKLYVFTDASNKMSPFICEAYDNGYGKDIENYRGNNSEIVEDYRNYGYMNDDFVEGIQNKLSEDNERRSKIEA